MAADESDTESEAKVWLREHLLEQLPEGPIREKHAKMSWEELTTRFVLREVHTAPSVLPATSSSAASQTFSGPTACTVDLAGSCSATAGYRDSVPDDPTAPVTLATAPSEAHMDDMHQLSCSSDEGAKDMKAILDSSDEKNRCGKKETRLCKRWKGGLKSNTEAHTSLLLTKSGGDFGGDSCDKDTRMEGEHVERKAARTEKAETDPEWRDRTSRKRHRVMNDNDLNSVSFTSSGEDN